MVDLKNKKSFVTLVRNIGSKRYFNRIDTEGVNPNLLEDEISKIESEISNDLREVVEGVSFPSTAHFHSIMNLIALIAARNPLRRTTLSGFHANVANKVMDLALYSEERWNHENLQMKENGQESNYDVSFEDLKNFHEEGNYKFVVDQTYLIGLELSMVETILKLLVQRNWCFVTTDQDCQFISSDNPAVLFPADTKQEVGFFSPGFGTPNTNLIFPLSSNLLLLSCFEDIPSTIHYEEMQVASINSIIAKSSQKQVYALSEKFKFLHPMLGLCEGDVLKSSFVIKPE